MSLSTKEEYWQQVKAEYDEKEGTQTLMDKSMWESAKAAMQEALAQMFPKQSNTSST
jgi:hypothetical protein